MWPERNTSKNRKLSLEHGGLVARGKTIGVSLHPIMLSSADPTHTLLKTTPRAFRPSVHASLRTPPLVVRCQPSTPSTSLYFLSTSPIHLLCQHSIALAPPPPHSCQGEWWRQVRSVCANMADSLGQLHKSRRVNSPVFRIV